MESGAIFPGEFVDKICAVLDFGGGLRLIYYSEQYTPMSFLQAHQVLTYESTEIRVLGFLGEVGMTTPEDPGEYSMLSGAGPNRFVSGAALFLSFDILSNSKRSSKEKAHCIYPYSGREPQITVAVRCNRLMPKGWPFPDSGTVTSHGRIRVARDIPAAWWPRLIQEQAVMFRLRHRAGWIEELYVTCAPVLFFQVYLLVATSLFTTRRSVI